MLGAIIMLFIIAPVLSKHHHFFRKDYTYIEEYDAFYKVHWDTSGWSWNSAFMACDNEDAKLFYPKGDEWTVVKNLTDAMVVPPNTTEIYVGLHNEFGLGEFITIDGRPTESSLNVEMEVDSSLLEDPDRCMLMDYTTGQFRVDTCSGGPYDIVPFVCKKVDEESCPTIDHNYKYKSNVKKCYKINNRPKTWQAAMQTCYMEGGVLAVLKDNDHHFIEGQYPQKYFIGFKKSFSSGNFYTVKGQKYDNLELKLLSLDTSKSCGILSFEYSPPRIYIESCTAELPFICEMRANNPHVELSDIWRSINVTDVIINGVIGLLD